MQFVGFDPGGEKKFGWTVLEATPKSLQFVGAGTGTGVAEVITAALRVLRGPPAGVGIDAPLFWAQEGDRVADQVVRALVIAAGGPSSTVMAVNSLAGACLVQGVLVAIQAHDLWPETQITEAHPTALLHVCSAAHAFVDDVPELAQLGAHAQHAALAAYAAHAWVTKTVGWHDLAAQEPRKTLPGGTAVAYWFPKGQS
jgi:hypothetical protein